MERSGWWVFSSTIEEVPERVGKLLLPLPKSACTRTNLPSLMTMVSCPGCFRPRDAIFAAATGCGAGEEVIGDLTSPLALEQGQAHAFLTEPESIRKMQSRDAPRAIFGSS